MKKLLAIAVTVAITAPAMADTSVYGSARMLIGSASMDAATTVLYNGLTVADQTLFRGGVGVDVRNTSNTFANNSSRIGLKGSNALNRGLTATHKIELGVDPTGGTGAVSNRSSYIGLKGRFGEIRGGSDWTPFDNIDDGAGVLTNGGERLREDGDRKNSIKYLGKFGPVGILASVIPGGNRVGGGTKHQLGVTYKAGPFYAGIGTGKETAIGASSPLVAALAYNGANYRVGFVHGKDSAGTKSNSIRGKYSFGNAYAAAEYTKLKDIVAIKQTDLEFGYGLGKGTKVYLQHKKTSGPISVKGTALGMQHDF